MANYNRVILVGNLTRDPQMSYLPNQTPVVELGMAINHRWKDQQGNQKEDVCFIDCRAYGRQAETLNTYLKKGQQVLIEGRLQFSMWEAKDGTKRSKHRVIVDRFQFMGAPSGAARAPSARPPAAAPPPPPGAAMAGPPMPEPPSEEPPAPGAEEEPPPQAEDIPF